MGLWLVHYEAALDALANTGKLEKRSVQDDKPWVGEFKHKIPH
jgi:hypothetical protein